jgi:adenine deaminase
MKKIGIILDVTAKEMFPGEIEISEGKIRRITRNEKVTGDYILPGLIDSHIHVESSMLTPGEFARASVPRGTIGVVADPHEIANILGINGVEYMIEDGKRTPMKFWFGAPSCVPATEYETTGALMDSGTIDKLLQRNEISHLAEVMNFPGVIGGNSELLKKIESAKRVNKPIDGHAPGLSGEGLKKYISAGISTDHECTAIDEAIEKITRGMKVIIREGSAARNLNTLKSLLRSHPAMVMLGSDDLHPEMLNTRHLDKIVADLISEGFDKFDVLRSVTLNPVSHYRLNAGLLRTGDPADFIVVDDLYTMNVLETWINGEQVYDNGKLLFEYEPASPANNFNCSSVREKEILTETAGNNLRVIQVFDGELFTAEKIIRTGNVKYFGSDTSRDILKIVVKDRYNNSRPAVGFINGFGLNSGAFASSVAHDSHNIIAVGTNDNDIIKAINKIVEMKGGLSISNEGTVKGLNLEIGGIMTARSCSLVAREYEELSDEVKEMGSPLKAPFMTLSFMALLVIPELKLSDKGLFDGRSFSFVPLSF